jgi:hypothetical protein
MAILENFFMEKLIEKVFLYWIIPAYSTRLDLKKFKKKLCNKKQVLPICIGKKIFYNFLWDYLDQGNSLTFIAV